MQGIQSSYELIDVNRNSRKIQRLRKDMGIEGYGIYLMLLEVLEEESENRYPLHDIDLLADDFATSDQKVMAVIKNYALFHIDDEEYFYDQNL